MQRGNYKKNGYVRYSADAIRRMMMRLNKKAGTNVQFQQIRDASYTAACFGGFDEAKLLAGHKISGMTDRYVLRNPKMVASACKAVAREFGLK